MVHSIELLLDDGSDSAVRRIWAKLADADLPSLATTRSPANRPHISMVVAERINPAVDSQLRELAHRLPLPCVLGAPLLFGGARFTLARLVVPSAELLALHADVHNACLPHLSPGPMAHTEPAAWTPHVTLCRRMDPVQLARALTVVRRLTKDIPSRLVGIRRWDGDKRVEHTIS